ncbi:outer membrane protein assembly factor BamB family protein [Actinomadura violacea]|uniref:Serine/threonine-protein kinase n=1 Tax=Actinomadura violacea TaxID=2819934 RepID=A0ABS3S6U2_9ACTN|nr:serine/threonine-protein kinase [Actinomadura violacea]MBO2464726.1 serine/threonine-protein kinase [Actinomadura violacea]
MAPLLAEDPRRIGGYTVVERLGAGGMGTVYLGRSASGLPVAIKVIHAGRSGEAAFRARFAREVTAARAVSGAFTAPVIDADPAAEDPWLVTAYLPGMSLQQAVAEHGPLPVPAVFGLGASLAEALVSVHRAGVVHRDLKPANVMLAPDGPRLIDFGIAHAAGEAVVTRTGHMVGSPGYLAPEQAVGDGTGPAADVFALGAVLAFAATGEGPFGRSRAEVLIYRVVHDPPRLDAVPDAGLRELVAGCLAKRPELRPAAADLVPRFAARAPAVEVLQGTSWLPAPVADEIGAAERSLAGLGRDRRAFLKAGAAAGAVAVLAGAAAAGTVLARGHGSPKKAAAGTSPSAASTPATPPDAVQVWQHDIGTDPFGGIAVADGMLLISADDGRLIALDARTGKQRWQHKKSGRDGGAAGWRTPVASGGVLYVGWPDTDGTLYAYDVKTGKERWRTVLPGDPREPGAGGGLVVVDAGDLVALRASDGSRRWHRNVGNVQDVTPAVAGGAVFTADASTVYALDAGDGHVRWRHHIGSGGDQYARNSPVASGGMVFCGSGDATLVALDAASGAERWHFLGGTAVGDPAVAGGAVFVGDGSGNMNALDARTGATRWRFATGDENVGEPSVDGGVLCFLTKNWGFGVDAASGRALWKTAVGNGVRADVAAGGLYHIGFESGQIMTLAVKGK